MPVLRRTLLGSLAALPLIGAAAGAQAAAPAQAGQAPSFFRYRVGDLQITAVNDGMAYRDIPGFISNASDADVRQALADVFLPTDKFPITFTTLVINTGSKLILIDTGNGDLAPPTAGRWMANFRAAGFEPSQVDTIVFSHFHGDHINGFCLKDGTNPFPQAQVMVPEPEWAYWMNDTERARATGAYMTGNFSNIRRVFDPIRKDVTMYRWDQEILPGITALRADGHTPGHTAFAIVSGAGKLLVMSDVTNNTEIFARHPDWSALFDHDADRARATRHRMLDIAATEKMQVSFYHAPFPATGHIMRQGAGYALVPAMWTQQA
jgi:glyoxylase-like metal-dependent hydrolase (beta-lactamase superfamily II)